jgi:hypothetical protein
LTRSAARVVIGGTVATAKPLPVQIELSEGQYLVLLKHATKRSRVSARLIAVAEPERKDKRSAYVFTGFVTDGLALRGVALVHAPDAVPAIDRGIAPETPPPRSPEQDRASRVPVRGPDPHPDRGRERAGPAAGVVPPL